MTWILLTLVRCGQCEYDVASNVYRWQKKSPVLLTHQNINGKGKNGKIVTKAVEATQVTTPTINEDFDNDEEIDQDLLNAGFEQGLREMKARAVNVSGEAQVRINMTKASNDIESDDQSTTSEVSEFSAH